MKKILTIFTPVYNRADKLQVLYKSLINQSDGNFNWIIIDDGSSDDTSDVIKQIIEEKKISVKAIYQSNQGKHVAHNCAVQMCETELFTCVDSDDELISSAVEEIHNYYYSHELCEENAGIIAWKGDKNGLKIGKYPSDMSPCSLLDLYKRRGMSGDTMLIFKTSVIKKYPFPVFDGEKFLREPIAYNDIDKDYQYLIFDKVLYLCEYCEDGLSRNASKLEMKSPKGAALFRWYEFKCSKNFQSKIRNLIAFVFFNRIANNNKESKEKLGRLFYPFWLLSWYGNIYYRRVNTNDDASR